MFMGEPVEKWSGLRDMSRRELAMLTPLLVIVIFLGVYPRPALDVIAVAMDQLIDLVALATQVAVQ